MADGSAFMRPAFRASDLAAEDVARAIPLLHTTWPKLADAAWREFAAAFRGGAPDEALGLVGLYDVAGGLCGLFAYRVEATVPGGRTLSIPLFTVVDLSNSLLPVRVLVEAAVARAEAQACTGLELRLDKGQRDLVRRLRGLGLERSAALHSLSITTH